jgi:hypothetical protein
MNQFAEFANCRRAVTSDEQGQSPEERKGTGRHDFICPAAHTPPLRLSGGLSEKMKQLADFGNLKPEIAKSQGRAGRDSSRGAG